MIAGDLELIIQNVENSRLERKTVLVTGGAGFLGSWICHVLTELSCTVICIDNFASGKMENIDELKKNKNFFLLNHDVSQPFSIQGRVDFVFHLASRASPFEFELFPVEIIATNSIGTMNALNIAREKGSILVFSSTSEIYGDATLIPTPESYNGNVNPVGIRGCYDEGKRIGEAVCMAYKRQHGVDVRIARIFNTYGPKMRSDGYYGRVVPRFIHQALNNQKITIFGDGTQTRSFCYITDQVEGLLKLASFDSSSGEIVNIGNPEECTILSLAEKIVKISRSDSGIVYHPLPPDDPKRRCPDIGKAKNLLSWCPKISLEEGLRKTITFQERTGS